MDPKTAWHRARLVIEALKRMHLSGFKILPRASFGGVRLVQYQFGETDFSLDRAGIEGSRHAEHMTGDGLDREALLYLSRVCSIANARIPRLWREGKDLRKGLCDSRKHLNTLNEVWWLDRWQPFPEATVEQEKGLLAATGKDNTVDWCLRFADGWTVNLEVKNGVRSNASTLGKDTWVFEQRKDGELRRQDPARKFRPSGPRELNVLAVTWSAELTTDMLADTQAALDDEGRATVIDAVILWGPKSRADPDWKVLHPSGRVSPEKRAALVALLVEPTSEDRLSRRAQLKGKRRVVSDIDKERAAEAIKLVAQLIAQQFPGTPTTSFSTILAARDVREIRAAGGSVGEFELSDLFWKLTDGKLALPLEFFSPRRQAWLPLAGIILDIFPPPLEGLRRLGFDMVQVMGSPPYDCPACNALVGPHQIGDVPALPPSACSCRWWSHLVIMPPGRRVIGSP